MPEMTVERAVDNAIASNEMEGLHLPRNSVRL